MRKALFILLIICTSCEPKQPVITNDIETLTKVFAMEKFNIEIGRYGCFGGETDLYELEKIDSKYKLTYLKSKNSIIVESKSIDSLKNFMKARLTTPNKTAICTGSMYFRAGNLQHSIDFTDESCQDWEIINETINFDKLIKKH